MTVKTGGLQGRGIAVTRPVAQADKLTGLITACGGNPISFPLLAIVPLADYSAFEQQLITLRHFDWAICISSNAVLTASSVAGANTIDETTSITLSGLADQNYTFTIEVVNQSGGQSTCPAGTTAL